MAYIWPMILITVSNAVYQICSKGTPGEISPFASLTVTYLVGALATAVMHLVTHPGVSLWKEWGKLNWAPFVLGLVIVGLEVGWIYAYRAGWPVSVGMIVHSSFLAVLLIFVGYFLYREPITWNKLVGMAICLVGLVFINMK